jgi:NRAMP (natural resistance-associated macrophage protein)-like metal ion transporter
MVTGAAGNDPSAITVYAIGGARFGPAALWLVLYALPLMIAIQDMCSRIGALSGCGLAGNIKRHYPAWILAPVAIAIILVNVLNVGANIYGMAGAVNLLVPLPVSVLALGLSAGIMVMVVKLRYAQIVAIFKWFALSLFIYAATLLLTNPDWLAIIKGVLIPTFDGGREYLLTAFAILGTTIAPYLFFWQASEEADEVRQARPHIRVCQFRPTKPSFLRKVKLDTRIGMTMSNFIAGCIMAVTAMTLWRAGIQDILTLRDAASALEPLAGSLASTFFMIGVLGSGLLAIPILAGAAAYVSAELFGWHASLDKPYSKARQFYLVMLSAVAVSMVTPFLGITPVQALFWIAVINGALTPPLILLISHMAANPKIVGTNTTSYRGHAFGLLAFLVMLTGSFIVLFS